MKIGLANIFPFRPHVSTLEFIARTLEKDNHDLHFLVCDAGLKNCHNLLVNGRGRFTGCLSCMVGGIRSFRGGQITSISSKHRENLNSKSKEWAFSTLATSLRSETKEYFYENYMESTLDAHAVSVEVAYANTIEWVKKNELDAVICFNGRMDVTRGIVEACKHLNVRYITYEYAWFGDGINFIPEGNCLHLAEPLRLITQYQKLPLNSDQVRHAASVIAKRLLKISDKEWRQYNMNPEYSDWPNLKKDELKVLILPSSFNEFLGHEDYVSDWKQPYDGFQSILEYLSDKNVNSILRCHPNWNQTISGIKGDHIEESYSKWAKDNGISTVIGSSEKIDTFGLIKQADLILLNSSSAALEAGIIGKPIVSTTPGRFQTSGFVTNIFEKAHLNRLDNIWDQDKTQLIKLVLRFLYTYVRRLPQYIENVKAVNPTKFNYFEGATPDALIKIIETGKVTPFDPTYAESEDFENEVIDDLLNENWGAFADFKQPENAGDIVEISRRTPFGLIDQVRDLFPRGDLK